MVPHYSTLRATIWCVALSVSILLAACSSRSTVTPLVAGHWELDTSLSNPNNGGMLVFLPEVSRGQRAWEHYDFNAQGGFVHRGPNAVDLPQTTTGTYQQTGNAVVLQWPQGTRVTWQIVRLTATELRITRTP
jgi:hypothetical protein